jgi:hypothetical protein
MKRIALSSILRSVDGAEYTMGSARSTQLAFQVFQAALGVASAAAVWACLLHHVNDLLIFLHTILSRFIPETAKQMHLRYISKTPTCYQSDLAMMNSADVTNKPIAVWSQSNSGVSCLKPPLRHPWKKGRSAILMFCPKRYTNFFYNSCEIFLTNNQKFQPKTELLKNHKLFYFFI